MVMSLITHSSSSSRFASRSLRHGGMTPDVSVDTGVGTALGANVALAMTLMSVRHVVLSIGIRGPSYPILDHLVRNCSVVFYCEGKDVAREHFALDVWIGEVSPSVN